MSPLTGRVVSLDEVPDEVFSERVMGDGAAVRPDDGEVVAPMKGRIEKLFEGGHGFAVENEAGLQVLVHIGIDTVHQKGEGFSVHASEGDDVEPGDRIVSVDLDALTSKGIDMISPIVVISGQTPTMVAGDRVAAGEPLLSVE
jgi:glucose-specific phosphotransferase system IIA component